MRFYTYIPILII